MIHVIASIDVQPGKRDEYVALFYELVPLVRAEAGCVEYGPTVDAKSGIERQVAYREDTVTIVEKWESLDALKAHLVAPHMNDFRAKAGGFVVGSTLQILETA